MILAPDMSACPISVTYADLTKTVASVLALPLAITTFYLGYRQKESERTRAYYHKAVVDVVMPQLITFFDGALENVMGAARDATKGLISTRKTMPPSVTKTLASFSEGLFQMQDAVIDRTLIFDEKTSDLLRNDFEQIQDDVANWFGEIALRKTREIEELPGLMKKGQRQIIKHLYRGSSANL